MKQKLAIRLLSLSLAFLLAFSTVPTTNAHAVSQEIPSTIISEQEASDGSSAEVFIKDKDDAQLQTELDRRF